MRQLSGKDIEIIQSLFNVIGEKLRSLSPYDYCAGDYNLAIRKTDEDKENFAITCYL